MTGSVTPELLRALCHELRGPIGAAGNWVHVLSAPEADAATRARALSGLKDDVRAMAAALDLVSNLASVLSATEAAVAPIDIDSCLRSLADALPSERRAVVRVSEPALRMLGDPARLRELLWLLLNGPPPASDLAVSSEKDAVVIVVTVNRTPPPLPLALATALSGHLGGSLTVEAAEKETRIRLRLDRAI